LSRQKLRSGFMMLGSAIGVASLTFVLTIGAAAQRKLVTTVRQLFGPASIIVTSGGGFFMGGPRGEDARLTLDDARALADALPAVEAWAPIQVLPGASVRYGDASHAVRLLGESERSERVWQRGVSAGEYFDAAAVASSARVALVGETVAGALFGDEDPLGASVLIGSVPFRVTGILAREGTDIHGMDRDNEVVIPISTAMRRVMNVDAIRAVKLLVRDPARVDETAAEVTRILRERHGKVEGQPSDFTLITPSRVQKTVAGSSASVPLPAAVAGISPWSAAVAATLMLSSVNERVGEIAAARSARGPGTSVSSS
jgi:putative ABC transport system permease protein